VLPIATDMRAGPDAWADILPLADRHRLTVYDAAYLELALRRKLPLASLDAELRAAGVREGVAVLP
jgi:predicted nucleic acid-binding protein